MIYESKINTKIKKISALKRITVKNQIELEKQLKILKELNKKRKKYIYISEEETYSAIICCWKCETKIFWNVSKIKKYVANKKKYEKYEISKLKISKDIKQIKLNNITEKELKKPIIIGNYYINPILIDGNHRAYIKELEGVKTINAYLLNSEETAKFIIDETSKEIFNTFEKILNIINENEPQTNY